MDKAAGLAPPRYERDGHTLTVENRFTGEKPLREAVKDYLAACREEHTP
ncbi:MAG: hypothetical protein K2N78_05200 [Oscillospiraceae bacterium]|nr:hypothetical protein [Oscillospiraceae bacterium]